MFFLCLVHIGTIFSCQRVKRFLFLFLHDRAPLRRRFFIDYAEVSQNQTKILRGLNIRNFLAVIQMIQSDYSIEDTL
jgi:hypothetical protein